MLLTIFVSVIFILAWAFNTSYNLKKEVIKPKLENPNVWPLKKIVLAGVWFFGAIFAFCLFVLLLEVI